jgi:hypothetical protein
MIEVEVTPMTAEWLIRTKSAQVAPTTSDARSTPRAGYRKQYLYKGQSLTTAQLVALPECVVPIHTIQERLSRGMRAEQAITQPLGKGAPRELTPEVKAGIIQDYQVMSQYKLMTKWKVGIKTIKKILKEAGL